MPHAQSMDLPVRFDHRGGPEHNLRDRLRMGTLLLISCHIFKLSQQNLHWPHPPNEKDFNDVEPILGELDLSLG